MSHPPNYPGRERLKKASARAGSDAYQGAFEAVGAVLVACGFGFFFDRHFETSPWGLVVGVVIGFAAMVLRLIRLGHDLHPDDTNAGTKEDAQTAQLDRADDGLGTGVSPGMSDVLREDEAGRETAATDSTHENDHRDER